MIMTHSFQDQMMKQEHLDVLAKFFCSVDAGCFKEKNGSIKSSHCEHQNCGQSIQQVRHCPGCSGTVAKMYNKNDISSRANDILFAAFTSEPKYKIKDIVQFVAMQPNVNQHLQ